MRRPDRRRVKIAAIGSRLFHFSAPEQRPSLEVGACCTPTSAKGHNRPVARGRRVTHTARRNDRHRVRVLDLQNFLGDLELILRTIAHIVSAGLLRRSPAPRHRPRALNDQARASPAKASNVAKAGDPRAPE
jgi:hypothetical protein